MSRIDIVIPMVFEDDVLWQSDFKHLGRAFDKGAFHAARWRSWGTERLLVRAIRLFMPWVGTIHVLLARESQVRGWMKEEDVHVVLHKEFIPERFLPTFNANTIEMFLHGIPDLSEHFIYSNDDIYPISPLDCSQFFNDGTPCQKYILDNYPKEPNTYQAFCLNGLNMIAEGFGRHFTDKWLVGGHSMSPFLKSTCERVWELHGEKILSTISQDRQVDNYNQYIYAYHQHLSGNYCGNIPPRLTVSVAYPLSEIRRILGKGFGVVCVNDHESNIDFEAYRSTVYEALEQKLKAY